MPQDKLLALDLAERVDQLEDDVHELSKSLAIVSDRLESLTKSSERLIDKMDCVIGAYAASNSRLEKVEDVLSNRRKNYENLKNVFYGVLIAGASVFMTHWAERLLGK